MLVCGTLASGCGGPGVGARDMAALSPSWQVQLNARPNARPVQFSPQLDLELRMHILLGLWEIFFSQTRAVVLKSLRITVLECYVTAVGWDLIGIGRAGLRQCCKFDNKLTFFCSLRIMFFTVCH